MSSNSSKPDTTRERVDEFLFRSGLRKASVRVVSLTGDASDRRYFRVMTNDGKSSVLALHTQAFEFEALPFVNVARLFQAVPLPVPDILDHADDLGVLQLQDLGDVTLQAHLGAAAPTEHASLYREAVSFLVRLQTRGRELASPSFIPSIFSGSSVCPRLNGIRRPQFHSKRRRNGANCMKKKLVRARRPS